jgi:hypothetical protein
MSKNDDINDIIVGKGLIPPSVYQLPPDEAEEDGYTLYPLTKRVVTSFAFQTSFTLESDVAYLPVVRYSGIYYSTKENISHFCGKFFFYEPNASLFVSLKNAKLFATKVDAFLYLLDETLALKLPLGTSTSRLVADAKEFKFFLSAVNTEKMRFFRRRKAVVVKLAADLLRYTHVSAYDPERCLREDANRSQRTAFWNHILNDNFLRVLARDSYVPENAPVPILYPTDNPSHLMPQWMNFFDGLDQPVCEMARALGIRVLIFQHEAGAHDASTEILCTERNFEDDLVTVTHASGRDVGAPRYPKVWFPDQDQILRVKEESKQYASPTFTLFAHWQKQLLPEVLDTSPFLTCKQLRKSRQRELFVTSDFARILINNMIWNGAQQSKIVEFTMRFWKVDKAKATAWTVKRERTVLVEEFQAKWRLLKLSFFNKNRENSDLRNTLLEVARRLDPGGTLEKQTQRMMD